VPMSRLCSRLYLGGIKDAERLAADNSAGITTVISLCTEEVVPKRRDVKYVRFPIEDARPVTRPQFEAVMSAIGEHIRNGKVLLHCGAGMSRSPVLAAAWSHRCLPSATGSSPAHPDSPERSARPMLLSCTSCQGYSLTLRGKLVQCDDCGAIQPAIIDRPRIVRRDGVIQELAARFFATGEDAMAAMREEEERALEKKKACEVDPPAAKGEADILASGDIAGKEIVKVGLTGTTLVLMFHDGTVQRQTIPYAAILAISYLLRVLDAMCWTREVLENRLLNPPSRRNER